VFKLGDIILVTSGNSKFAGLTGTITKRLKGVIVAKASKSDVEIRVDHNDVVKITKKQQKEFKNIFKES
jgi:hypothetical protein